LRKYKTMTICLVATVTTTYHVLHTLQKPGKPMKQHEA
jgi:hypothetical protein